MYIFLLLLCVFVFQNAPIASSSLFVANPVSKKNKPVESHPDQSGDKSIFPGKEWPTNSPETFGFSSKNLAEVKSYFEDIGGDACVVIKNGFEIVSWGDCAKPIPNFSIRKSFLNSLFGIEYGKGNLSLSTTLSELNIDDKNGLTENEKQANIRNILSSSSGIYHVAAHESKQQAGARPPRESFKPGAFFYYNNWDFNVLGHIYLQLSKQDIFQSFR